MKGNKIFDFSRSGFQNIINIMQKKINEVVDLVNNIFPTIDEYISKINWDNIINSELYQKVVNGLKETNEQVKEKGKLINGLGVNINTYSHVADITNRIQTALNENDHVIIPTGEYSINSITIPENKILECVGTVTLNISGTIFVGVSSQFIGYYTSVNAENITIDDFSIIKVSKKSIVDIYSITGYRKEGSTKGDGTVSKAIDCTESDFVNINIRWRILRCKFAFYIKGGETGTGLTVNGSEFKCKWIGNCKYAVYQDGASDLKISTDFYAEGCNFGYSTKAGFYGVHFCTMDNVDNWFEDRSTNFRSRLGDVYLNDKTYNDLINKGLTRMFSNTKFHLKDCDVLPRDTDTKHLPNILSAIDGKIFAKSGSAEFRIVGEQSNQYEGKKSINDSSGGVTFTINETSGHFVIEKRDETPVFDINVSNGLISSRGGYVVGSGTTSSYITLTKGGVTFTQNQPSSSAPNNTFFMESNVLKFKNNLGEIKIVTLS